MRPRGLKIPRRIWLSCAIISGMAYPLLVYFGLPLLPPSLIVAAALCVLMLRLTTARRGGVDSRWLRPLITATVALIALAVIDPVTAAKAYPVVLSLAFAFMFGASLIWPPTIVESLARLTEPDLSPEGIGYTRVVTCIWTVFLCVNAAVAAAIGLWGSMAQWVLWNGLVSYLLMGSLFIGEMIVRRFLRSRA